MGAIPTRLPASRLPPAEWLKRQRMLLMVQKHQGLVSLRIRRRITKQSRLG